MESSQKKKKINNGSSNSICTCYNQDHHHQIKEEDRLSCLPDSLIITILSLLPVRSAASTSVLSRRWRYLWTHITDLFVDFYPSDPIYTRTLFDHIFSQLKSPKIHSFSLQVSRVYPTHNLYFSFLAPWFHHIYCRKPEVISVVTIGALLHSSKIPSFQFESQYLVAFLSQPNFKFPYLKKLALDLYDTNICLIGEHLFQTCPLLEDLILSFLCYEDDRIVDISVPDLKRLSLHVMAEDSEGFKLVINTPNLEKFYLQGNLTFFDFIDNPSSLQQAEISITQSYFNDDNVMSKIPGLFQGISCVRSLVIRDCSIYVLLCINDVLDAPPMFHNLMYLSLCCNCNADLDVDTTELPRCFLSGSLKRVDVVREVFPHDSHDAEMELIKHILSNAMVLEKLRVYVSNNDIESIVDKQIKFDFCKKLFKLSKSSVNCQIEFCVRQSMLQV